MNDTKLTANRMRNVGRDIKIKLKRRFCNHDFNLIYTKEVGLTMNWLAKLQMAHDFHYMCRKCGKRKVGSYLIHGEESYESRQDYEERTGKEAVFEKMEERH